MQRPRTVVALGLWLVGLSYLAATTRPFPIVELIGALVLALLAVLLAMLGTSGASRIAKYLFWVNAIGGLVWAMAFASDMFAGAWLAGVCAYGVVVSLEKVLWGFGRSTDVNKQAGPVAAVEDRSKVASENATSAKE